MNDTKELIAFVERHKWLKQWLHPFGRSHWIHYYGDLIRAIRDNWPKEMEWYPCDAQHEPEQGRIYVYVNSGHLNIGRAFGKWGDINTRWCYLPPLPPEPTEAEKAWEEYCKTNGRIETGSLVHKAFMAAWQKAREGK